MKKKILSIILTLALILTSACACTKQEATKSNKKKSSRGSSKDKDVEAAVRSEEDAEAEAEVNKTEDTAEPDPTPTPTPTPAPAKAVDNRDEIIRALGERTALIPAIDNGRLHEVKNVKGGINSPFTLTFDSYMADPLCFCYFMKIDGTIYPDDSFRISNCKMTNADTGEEIYIVHDYAYFPASGELAIGQVFWENTCPNFDMDFDLIDLLPDYTEIYVESYHFEFRDVEYTPAKVFELDQNFAVGNQVLHFRELRVSENCTEVVFDDVPNSYIHSVDLCINDEYGEMISYPVAYTISGFMWPDDNDQFVWVNNLPSIYYSGVEDFSLYVMTCFGAFSDGQYLKIDPRTSTAEFGGRTFDVQIYTGHPSYADFGLPANDYMDSLDSPIFLVPSLGLPEINSTYDNQLKRFSYNGEDYPHVVIDNIDYIAIQCPDFFADEEDGCYYFIHGSDNEYYDIYEDIPLKMSEGKES